MDETKNSQQETKETKLQEQEKKSDELQGKVFANQMSGLTLEELIEAPLEAACKAQQQLSMELLKEYERMVVDADRKTRYIEFEMERPDRATGETDTQKVTVKAPFQSIVPMPSLQMDDINLDFQMEVNEESGADFSDDAEVSSEINGKWFSTSVSVQGKITTPRENRCSTKQAAEFQRAVSASPQNQAEGLSKLMDIMASCVDPIDGKKG